MGMDGLASLGDCRGMSRDINSMRVASEWSPAKQIHKTYGITAPQLRRYAKDGMIRSSNIRRPGQVRGIRLFNLGDIDKLIEESIEPVAGSKGESTTGNTQPPNDTRA